MVEYMGYWFPVSIGQPFQPTDKLVDANPLMGYSRISAVTQYILYMGVRNMVIAQNLSHTELNLLRGLNGDY